ncbi:hypothetical protein GCM10010483_19170 [Actinokineospora diospyrosa]
MTNEDLFRDLKQFIATTVSQEVSGLRQEMQTALREVVHQISDLDTKLDTIQQAVGESLHTAEQQHQDHERHISRLERRAA